MSEKSDFQEELLNMLGTISGQLEKMTEWLDRIEGHVQMIDDELTGDGEGCVFEIYRFLERAEERALKKEEEA